MEWAYQIQPSQHSAGPAWLRTDRYDMLARAEGHPNEDQMRAMVQTLLEERFKLKLHPEKKKVLAYVLSKGKNEPRLYAPKDVEPHAMRISPVMGPDQKIVSYHITVTRFSLAQLTDTMARQLGRVLVNETGLDGEFDFTMDFTPDEERPNPLDAGIVLTAMREQLGLVVTSKTTEVKFVEIESAERVAAGNQ
jgi:uncharacterized protein (TIGR03435 family)